MSKVAKIFGSGADTGALKKQQEAVAAETRRVRSVEEGQRRARQGGGGFLAFLDEQLKGSFGG